MPSLVGFLETPQGWFQDRRPTVVITMAAPVTLGPSHLTPDKGETALFSRTWPRTDTSGKGEAPPTSPGEPRSPGPGTESGSEHLPRAQFLLSAIPDGMGSRAGNRRQVTSQSPPTLRADFTSAPAPTLCLRLKRWHQRRQESSVNFRQASPLSTLSTACPTSWVGT